MITLFQNSFPGVFDPWSLKEEISFCNSAGECGYERLKDFGILLVNGSIGDIEIAKNGYCINPCNTAIAYSNEGPKVLPDYYDKVRNQDFLSAFIGIDTNPEYLTKIFGKHIQNIYQSGCCAPFNYITNWANKQNFCAVFTRITDTKFDRYSKYDLAPQKKEIVNSAYSYFGENFHIYGTGFPHCSTFFGEVGSNTNWQQNKLDRLAQYKFNMCIENSDFDRYVTEKIMHALIARSIPIYFGTESVKKLIPKELFINIRDFETYDDCWNYVRSLSEQRIQSMIADIDNFVRDSKNTYLIDSLRWADEIVRLCKDKGII